MNKIEKKEFLLLAGVFVFFTTLLFLIPITGDDWYNYTVGEKGFVYSVQNAITMYFTWEGRFISRLLINFFTCHRLFYIFFTSFSITVLCYLIANFYQTKYKYLLYFLVLLFLLTLENTMWTQSFLWVAGSITYLYPCILFIGYLYYYFHVIRCAKKLFWYHYLFSSIFSFMIVMFVENLAVAYLAFHFVVFCYHFYKTRKVDRFLFINGIVALVGFLLMFFSPGSLLRSMADHPDFKELSLFSKISVNIPNFIHYTFLSNIPLLILLLTTYISLIYHFFESKWKYFFSLLIFFIFSTFIIIVFLHQSAISSVGWNFLFLHLYPLVFVIALLVFGFIFLLFRVLSMDKVICFLLVLLVALSNNLVMFFSPVWGGRVAFFTILSLVCIFSYFLINFSSCCLFSGRRIIIFIATCTFFLMVITLFRYYEVHRFMDIRNEKIKDQLLEKRREITVYTLPNNLLWGSDPYDAFHIQYFKEYYDLPSDAILIYQTYTEIR